MDVQSRERTDVYKNVKESKGGWGEPPGVAGV